MRRKRKEKKGKIKQKLRRKKGTNIFLKLLEDPRDANYSFTKQNKKKVSQHINYSFQKRQKNVYVYFCLLISPHPSLNIMTDGNVINDCAYTDISVSVIIP